MDLNGKKILVTGADGFIGSHLTERLVRDGRDVRAFCYYNSFDSRGWLDAAPADVRDNTEFFLGDVRDPHGVRRAAKGCDVILHLAALIAIPFSYHSPDAYVQTNVTGTLNVLQAARDEGAQRVVHTSTSEVYGTALTVPIDEDHPLQGQSPYSATKIGADQMALAFHRSFDTPVAILRPFNTFGPRQSARAVIPTIITQIAGGARRIELGSLTPTRDFNHVADTVEAFVRIAECDAAVGDVVNAGSGREESIGDLAADIATAMGANVEIALDAQRVRPEKSEVDRLLAGTAKAARLWGWAPRCATREGFLAALAETVEWFADPANLARYRTGGYAI
ncbi:MAG: SDR family NAD(P)-dependent oxidoreductase [Desulfovibrionaceae bacterium]|jgi:dTDP-glucose 4,6-dehydratase|nr:SDR family NAD(P)-dependent oxidoreductase [Desulfovibrionaceae bacterium]